MIKHISMFSFKGDAGGKTKEENINEVRQLLLDLPSQIPFILTNEVGAQIKNTPETGADAPPVYDLVQIITFETPENAAAYPAHPAHLDLVRRSDAMVEKMAMIDYEV